MTDWCRYYYKRIILDHNYKLARSPSMTKQMSGYKMKDVVVDVMVNIMHKARVSHVKVIHVLHESVGGPQNLSVTECDIQNRYSRCLKTCVQFLYSKMTHILIEWLTSLIREEAIDDIRKLQALSDECKSNNPQFYYKFQLDENNVVKNVFWSHASQQGKYKGNSKISSIHNKNDWSLHWWKIADYYSY
jgi:hypothetical protein